MIPAALTFFALALIAFCIAACLHFHKRGYRLGHKAGCQFGFDEGYTRGFEAGHAAAERWMAEAEVAVQEMREQIWREEA